MGGLRAAGVGTGIQGRGLGGAGSEEPGAPDGLDNPHSQEGLGLKPVGIMI